MDPVTTMTLAGMGFNIIRALLLDARNNPKSTHEQKLAITGLLMELDAMVIRVEAVEIRDVG